MVDARDGTRRSQRDKTAVVTGPGDIDPADLPDDPAEAVLEALPEPLRIALERAIAETGTTVRQVVLDAEEAGQTVNEVIRDQFDQFIPDEGEVPDEEDGEDDDGTSIADLVGEAEPEVFDRTFLVEKEDAPASTGDPWPVPQPWQGLPRIAYVINLNYVYDEANEEWVRQGPFEGGGGVFAEADSGQVSLTQASSPTTVDTGVTDRTTKVLVICSLQQDPLPDTTIGVYPGGNVETTTAVVYQTLYDDNRDEWRIAFRTDISGTITVNYSFLVAERL